MKCERNMNAEHGFHDPGVPIPTASFLSSHREQNAPFSAFQKQRGQDISPVPLCFFSLFLFKHKKRETETKQKSLFSSFLIFKRKKERSQKSIGNKGKKKEKTKEEEGGKPSRKEEGKRTARGGRCGKRESQEKVKEGKVNDILVLNLF